ncbi:MAG: hypothetical protein WB816_11310 [Methylocystis sp.]
MLLQVTKFEQSPWPRLLAPMLAGLLLAAAYQSAAHATTAARDSSYLISDNDGYGLVDCITQKRECGKIVADGWCEAHGHGPATTFGAAEDVTGAISASSSPSKSAAMVICSE